MDLGHGHGHAAGKAGEDEEALQHGGSVESLATAAGGDGGAWPFIQRGAAAQEQRQRQHERNGEDAQRNIGIAPAIGLDAPGEEGRPDGAGDVVSGCGNGDCDAAALLEPERDVSNQRPENRGAAQADENRLAGNIDVIGGSKGRGDETEPQHDGAQEHGHHDAETVGEPPHQQAAEGKADHAHGVGERGAGAVNVELNFNEGQDDNAGPDADAANGGQRQGHGKAEPGIGAVLRGGSGVHGRLMSPAAAIGQDGAVHG